MDVERQIPARPLRILIVRVGAMGDVLHGIPAIAALRNALRGCFIGWAIEPRWQALLRVDDAVARGPHMPLVDRIHLVPTREWKDRPFSVATLRQIAQLRREMRAEQYDLCVDLQGSIRSAVIGRMAAAQRFFGPRRPRERQARALYGERVHIASTNVIDQACELIAAAIGLPLTPSPVILPTQLQSSTFVDTLLGRSHDSTILLAHSAGWGAKQWGTANYRNLAQRLGAADRSIFVNAASADEPAANAIAADTPTSVIATSLPELIALTRRMSLVIGGDTGPVHLAAALGRPVLALFGPTDPARNGPYFPGANVRVLRNPASRLDHKRHTETEPGLAGITVDEAAQAALELLNQRLPEKTQRHTDG